MSESITVTVDWTPALLQEGNRAFRKAAPKRMVWLTMGWFFVSLLTAYVVGDDLFRAIRGEDGGVGASYEAGYGDGLMTLFVAMILIGIGIPLLNRLSVREFYSRTPFFERPWTMELSVHGIRSKGPYNAGMIEWPAIVGVVRSKSATVLSLGGGGFVPLPHAGLPEGLTPDRLMERIEIWRGAGDF